MCTSTTHGRCATTFPNRCGAVAEPEAPQVTRSARRAQLIGTGLIGGSVGLVLKAQGWHVTGFDADESAASLAIELGAIDEIGLDLNAEVCFVALPVGSVAAAANRLLDMPGTNWVVTDVGSVKAPIAAAVAHPRFVGGHPMAGSEVEGVAGSRADMFDGAVWVLTPSEQTDPLAHVLVHSIVAGFGAEVLTLAPELHDRIVALVSHVPHLTAVTLMGLASSRAQAQDHQALLRLAAGGFRDMTRIAGGHPAIWPDICAENRDAILEILDAFMIELGEVRTIVANGDRPELIDRLERSREARINLPTTAGPPSELVELLVTVKDRPGELARITAMATEMQVNIYDIEIAHSAERPSGLVIMLVDLEKAQPMVDELLADGYSVAQRRLG